MTGTLSEFNTALSGGSFASLAGSESLTNKTLSSPTVSGTVTLSSTPIYSGAVTFSGGIIRLDNHVVVNDSGADVDFRVEGENDTELFFVDGSADAIGISTTTPSADKLHILGDSGNPGTQIVTIIEYPDDTVGSADAILQLDYSADGTIGGDYVNFQNLNGETGSITGTGSDGVTYNTSSDKRLKKNIKDLTGCLSKVNAMSPKTFDWKSSGQSSTGFIAQDLFKVFPDAVKKGDSGKKVKNQWGIDYGRLSVMLVGAVQELTAKVEELEKKVTKLEDK